MARQQSRNSKVPLIWTANQKTDEGKREFERQLEVSNSPVMRRLLEIVVEKKELSATNSLSTNRYDNPNWAFVQADSVGYQRALEEIAALIKGITQ